MDDWLNESSGAEDLSVENVGESDFGANDLSPLDSGEMDPGSLDSSPDTDTSGGFDGAPDQAPDEAPGQEKKPMPDMSEEQDSGLNPGSPVESQDPGLDSWYQPRVWPRQPHGWEYLPGYIDWSVWAKAESWGKGRKAAQADLAPEDLVALDAQDPATPTSGDDIPLSDLEQAPTNEPTAEPVAEPMPEPMPEPATEPVVETAPEATTETTTLPEEDTTEPPADQTGGGDAPKQADQIGTGQGLGGGGVGGGSIGGVSGEGGDKKAPGEQLPVQVPYEGQQIRVPNVTVDPKVDRPVRPEVTNGLEQFQKDTDGKYELGISSTYRTPAEDIAAGGSGTGAHTTGNAVDINRVNGKSPLDMTKEEQGAITEDLKKVPGVKKVWGPNGLEERVDKGWKDSPSGTPAQQKQHMNHWHLGF